MDNFGSLGVDWMCTRACQRTECSVPPIVPDRIAFIRRKEVWDCPEAPEESSPIAFFFMPLFLAVLIVCVCVCVSAPQCFINLMRIGHSGC